MSELDHLMPRVIEELEKKQDFYVILSDEEYVKSAYFKNPNRKIVGKQQWIHCIDPATNISIVEIYFKKNEIAIPLSHKEVRNFQTNIAAERKVMKPGSKNQYISLRIRRDGEIELVEDTVAIALEILRYVHEDSDDIHTPMLPKGIIKKDDEFIVICGRCGEQYRKANRCTFCGQTLKWPKEDEIHRFVDTTIINE